jgi:hypothetical protein
MDELIVIILAAIIGSVIRILFGYAGESDVGEKFSGAKAGRSLVRGIIGGCVIGAYCFYTNLVVDPVAVFLLTFTGAITVDLIVKDIGDAFRKGKTEQQTTAPTG